MYKFHERYMEMSAKGREMFGARIKNPDFLQGEDVLWIHFKDLFDLYQLDALDVSLLSSWILNGDSKDPMTRVYDTGFIDPRKINTEMIDKYEKDTEDNLVHLLTQQHFRTYILLPYNTEFHWVLLFFDLDACKVTVYDSMNKEEKIFDKVVKLIDRAWDRFRQLVRGTWKEKLGRRFHFPHIHMRDNLPRKDFITAVQEQLIGFINEEVLNPDGEFYYDGSTIHNVGPSSSDITPASKS
uniref:OSJNBa0059D20.13 protein n=1 Tax=Oryza sativa subsp. japonica TaxID=39947 RepID=Q7XX48_ORYSJ|nr:OSJNBa0059D20.13 [Oryza sativa Japonica Group]